MQQNIKAARGVDWMLVGLFALLFVVLSFTRGPSVAGIATASVAYVAALMNFSVAGITALLTRTRPGLWAWLSGSYALAFFVVALAISFEPLKFVSLLGVIFGVCIGAYVGFLARRLTAK